MVAIENHIGTITVSEKYLSELVEHTVSNCFGVAGICSSGVFSSALSAVAGGKFSGKNKGIQIKTDKNGNLIINLHIKVTYGTNISAAVTSITHKVGFTVEEAVGFTVNQVNVYVDEMNY